MDKIYRARASTHTHTDTHTHTHTHTQSQHVSHKPAHFAANKRGEEVCLGLRDRL